MAGTADEPEYASNGDVRIAFTDDGYGDDPPLLLIPGIGNQLIAFEEEFVQGLVDRAFRVIRIDNRDAGLSTQIDSDLSLDDFLAATEAGEPFDPPYSLEAMAGDAVAVLDHLQIDRAHILGASMGGMIAQAVALGSPERVQSLTLLSTTTGSSDVGQPTEEALAALLASSPTERAAMIEHSVATRRIWSTVEYFDEGWLRSYFERCFDRSHTPAGSARQMLAIVTAADREAALSELPVPTLVLHGTDDPLVAPNGGERLAELIPNAELVLLEGMGHDLPPHYWAPVIESVTSLAIRSAQAARSGPAAAQ